MSENLEDSQVIKSIAIVTVAIAVLGIVVFAIAQNIGVTKQTPATKSEVSVNERIAKVGSSKAMSAKDAMPKAARSGAEIVAGSCGACHAAGVAGAPKIGSKADWETRAAAGMDAMTAAVVNGKGIMPPRGGANVSDEEIVAAIKDMMANSGM